MGKVGIMVQGTNATELEGIWEFEFAGPSGSVCGGNE